MNNKTAHPLPELKLASKWISEEGAVPIPKKIHRHFRIHGTSGSTEPCLKDSTDNQRFWRVNAPVEHLDPKAALLKLLGPEFLNKLLMLSTGDTAPWLTFFQLQKGL